MDAASWSDRRVDIGLKVEAAGECDQAKKRDYGEFHHYLILIFVIVAAG